MAAGRSRTPRPPPRIPAVDGDKTGYHAKIEGFGGGTERSRESRTTRGRERGLARVGARVGGLRRIAAGLSRRGRHHERERGRDVRRVRRVARRRLDDGAVEHVRDERDDGDDAPGRRVERWRSEL